MFKKAFTLAEVLITLGIIGVVAAITLPNLIKAYKKHEVEVRLEQNYSIIQNALLMAQAEHGDPATWEGLGITKTRPNVVNFFEKYLLKYMKIDTGGRFSLTNLGYKTPVYRSDGKTVFMSAEQVSTKYRMNNGSTIPVITVGSKTYKNEKYYSGLYLYLDLNGPKIPNTIGKDIFAYYVDLSKNRAEVGFRADTFAIDSETLKAVSRRKFTHEELVDDCGNAFGYITSCGQLILENGWKIPDDYPLKF